MSIVDDLCGKKGPWISHGTILEKGDESRPAFYPKCGVEFTCKEYASDSEKDRQVPKYKKKADGTWVFDRNLKAKAYKRRKIKISVSEKNIADPDPVTGKKPVKFQADFLAKYQATEFIECGNYLVNKNPIPVMYKGKKEIINIIIEIYGKSPNKKMLQRFYWTGSYLGTYCCT